MTKSDTAIQGTNVLADVAIHACVRHRVSESVLVKNKASVGARVDGMCHILCHTSQLCSSKSTFLPISKTSVLCLVPSSFILLTDT
ncbi:hypothetical protein PAXRUDRAFT_437526 [Paxillus rubicundulus Ve08.2h10]|uniref:Uncharacterized protein n=1 Tax=Paxillus rubicundulus Ve08.2h10 TaxID=930991 RepID=A0A0D0E851_9AGAM|nr:hypothetical protein PAXRUDRAFT_437526 [Paxillus rubicundulus Ve08.2h10]